MLRDSDLVSVQEVRTKVEAAWKAFQTYRTFNQQQVDRVVEAIGAAGRAYAKALAEMAVEETGYGNVHDKIAKNFLNADLLVRTVRGMKTVGVLREIADRKLTEIGVPLGVIGAVLPTTNPTSTVIFKSVISLKAGNAVVISPHPRAAKCTAYTANLLHGAAVEAGAPEGIIQCISSPTMESTHALMKHERIAMILATGGQAMVRAAYSSGKPAFGVGPGNVPVYLERSADIAAAVAKVVSGKAFDYGTVCSSEQALVTEESLRDAVIAELKRNRAFFCNEAQKQALTRILLKENFRINPECVGQSPQKLGRMAGFDVPADAAIIVAEIGGVGKAHPLSVEKLSPVLALCFVKSHEAALDACEALLRFGGLGHTCVIFSQDDARVREFGLRMPAMRVLVNTDSPGGSTGITTNLMPSMTLGCGAAAGNITSDNVGPQHLINVKRIASMVRTAAEAMTIPAEFSTATVKAGAPVPVAARAAAGVDAGVVAQMVEKYLNERGITAANGGPAVNPAGSAARDVVDRFLSGRACPPAAGSCGCAQTAQCPCSAPRPASEQVIPAPQPAPATIGPKPPAPEVVISEFVCENDVRAAIQNRNKIFIGPKSIVTPSAREIGEQNDVLVVAQR